MADILTPCVNYSACALCRGEDEILVRHTHTRAHTHSESSMTSLTACSCSSRQSRPSHVSSTRRREGVFLMLTAVW